MIYRLFERFDPRGAISRRIGREFNLEELLELHGSVRTLITQRIYEQIPHFKYKDCYGAGFASFVVSHVSADAESHFLDLGSHDGFLDRAIGSHLALAKFTCIDNVVQPAGFYSERMRFIQGDILQWIRNCPESCEYDFVIMSGVLSLFSPAERTEILQWIKEHSAGLFLREVPRYSDMIDVYLDKVVSRRPSYDLFTETSLISLLEENEFDVVKVIRDTDYFVFARPQGAQ